MNHVDSAVPSSCCAPPARCIFAKALLAHAAICECAERRAEGEQTQVLCTRPTAQANCATLAALLHERSRFALRLPAPGRPLLHAQALRLQCGGLAALHRVLDDDASERDAHRALLRARERFGSLTELPWPQLVAAVAAWLPPRHGR